MDKYIAYFIKIRKDHMKVMTCWLRADDHLRRCVCAFMSVPVCFCVDVCLCLDFRLTATGHRNRIGRSIDRAMCRAVCSGPQTVAFVSRQRLTVLLSCCSQVVRAAMASPPPPPPPPPLLLQLLMVMVVVAVLSASVSAELTAADPSTGRVLHVPPLADEETLRSDGSDDLGFSGTNRLEPAHLKRLWGVSDATARAGRLFVHPIDRDAFQGTVTHFEVSTVCGLLQPLHTGDRLKS